MFTLLSSWCRYHLGHVAMATKWESTEAAMYRVKVMEWLTPLSRRKREGSQDLHLEMQPLFPPAHLQLQVILKTVKVHRKWKVNRKGDSMTWWGLTVIQLFGAHSCSCKTIPPWWFISNPSKRIGRGGAIPQSVLDALSRYMDSSSHPLKRSQCHR